MKLLNLIQYHSFILKHPTPSYTSQHILRGEPDLEDRCNLGGTIIPLPTVAQPNRQHIYRIQIIPDVLLQRQAKPSISRENFFAIDFQLLSSLAKITSMFTLNFTLLDKSISINLKRLSLSCASVIEGKCFLQILLPCSMRLVQRQTTFPEGRVRR